MVMCEFPTAETSYSEVAGVPAAGWAAKHVDAAASLPTKSAGTPVLEVSVNAGRWVVQCPHCASGQFASSTDQRFLCVPSPHGCSNAEVNGGWLTVTWPSNPDEIEAALKPRPEPNRNWLPGETVDDLLAENAANGVS